MERVFCSPHMVQSEYKIEKDIAEAIFINRYSLQVRILNFDVIVRLTLLPGLPEILFAGSI